MAAGWKCVDAARTGGRSDPSQPERHSTTLRRSNACPPSPKRLRVATARIASDLLIPLSSINMPVTCHPSGPSSRATADAFRAASACAGRGQSRPRFLPCGRTPCGCPRECAGSPPGLLPRNCPGRDSRLSRESKHPDRQDSDSVARLPIAPACSDRYLDVGLRFPRKKEPGHTRRQCAVSASSSASTFSRL